jgi:DNA-binding CsgD family transcriptional regulator
VKKFRGFPKLVQQKKRDTSLSNLFVFCEKKTGIAQFRAASNAENEGTVDRIAGLLAMQCLVRGQNPGDFEIMVPADPAIARQLAARANELLEEGRAVACPASLSERQMEVLHSVIDNRANKEIASKLNITVRTVKFHISTLLSKFGVESRAELARRAAGFLRPTVLEGNAPTIERNLLNMGARDFESMPIETTFRIASKTRNVRFPGRVLTA